MFVFVVVVVAVVLVAAAATGLLLVHLDRVALLHFQGGGRVVFIDGSAIEPEPHHLHGEALHTRTRQNTYKSELVHNGQCCCCSGHLTARSQYAFISLRSGVCFLILNCTTALSCPSTFKLMCSDSVALCGEDEEDQTTISISGYLNIRETSPISTLHSLRAINENLLYACACA